MKTREFDLVLSDFNIAGFEGLQVLEAVAHADPSPADDHDAGADPLDRRLCFSASAGFALIY